MDALGSWLQCIGSAWTLRGVLASPSQTRGRRPGGGGCAGNRAGWRGGEWPRQLDNHRPPSHNQSHSPADGLCVPSMYICMYIQIPSHLLWPDLDRTTC